MAAKDTPEGEQPARANKAYRRRTVTVAIPLDDRIRREMAREGRGYSGILHRALSAYFGIRPEGPR